MTPRKKSENTDRSAPESKKTTGRTTKKKAAPKTRSRKTAPKKTEKASAQVSGSDDVVTEEPVATPEDEGRPTGEATSLLDAKIIVFFLDEQRYALPISSVQEIQQIVEFSEVPAQGGPLVGMVNLRGVVIPALDARLLVGLPRVEYRLETPMIICRTDGQLVAMIVDEVEDVLTMPEGCLQDPPRMHALAGRMKGVCRMDRGLIYLLDIDKMLEPVGLSG